MNDTYLALALHWIPGTLHWLDFINKHIDISLSKVSSFFWGGGEGRMWRSIYSMCQTVILTIVEIIHTAISHKFTWGTFYLKFSSSNSTIELMATSTILPLPPPPPPTHTIPHHQPFHLSIPKLQNITADSYGTIYSAGDDVIWNLAMYVVMPPVCCLKPKQVIMWGGIHNAICDIDSGKPWLR